MRRWQFWIFNVVSLALGALFLGNFLVSRSNQRLGQEIGRKQEIVNQGRQAEPVLDQLAKRVARGSETDPQLTNVLRKVEISVTLKTDGKDKTYP